MFKQLLERIRKWFFPRITPEIPQRKKTGLPAMERRLAASRNIVDTDKKVKVPKPRKKK